jgi:signal transduction histidine kinase
MGNKEKISMAETKKSSQQKNTHDPTYSATNNSNESKLLELAHNLSERIKELNCLYGISRLVENSILSLEAILQSVVDLIPPAWQYPEITCARISLDNTEYKTANFKKTSWKQSQNITVNGIQTGAVEVYYLGKRQESDEGPFLKEERNLLMVISERLGHIIEHKLAEEKALALYQKERQLRQQLQTEMRVRIDFTRKLIHELKTPLTALIATSQLLQDETRGGKYEKLAKYVFSGANDLNQRIEELHDVTKGEIGALKLNYQKMYIEKFLHSLSEETRAFMQQCNLKLELQLQDSLPVINADPDRIRQVILNLLNNACKYAKEGKRILLKAYRQADDLVIEVQDFGPGIPEERQPTLFEPGYQLAHHEDRSGGLGIGLALCKMIVELHGGKIWLTSKIGKGSSFFFTIPLKVIVVRNDR